MLEIVGVVCRTHLPGVADQRLVLTSSLSAVNEEIIKSTADILVSSGLHKAGYEYLVIDGRNIRSATSYCCSGACGTCDLRLVYCRWLVRA